MILSTHTLIFQRLLELIQISFNRLAWIRSHVLYLKISYDETELANKKITEEQIS